MNLFTEVEEEEVEAVKTHPNFEIDKINRFGEVTINFNETMIVPANWTKINSTDLDISVKAFDPERQALKLLDWEIKNFGTKTMMIMIEFVYPTRISEDIEGRDMLEVTVINPSKFFSQESLITIKNLTSSEYKLPY